MLLLDDLDNFDNLIGKLLSIGFSTPIDIDISPDAKIQINMYYIFLKEVLDYPIKITITLKMVLKNTKNHI